MSLALDKVPVTLVDDPKLVFDQWSIPARIGGDAISYNFVSVTNPSGSINFTVQPSNPSGAVISPCMIWYSRVLLTINTGAGGGGDLCIQGYSDAPRAYPMTSCCNSITITINGTPVNFTNLNMIGHALRRFNPRAAMYKAANFCPWYPDSGCANYGDLVLTNRNPLSAGGVGDLDFTRGAYQRVRYLVPPGGDAAYQCNVILETYEPVNLSPFLFDMHQQGLPYVQNLNVEFNLVGSLARTLSHAIVAGQNVAIANNQVTAATITESRLYYQQVNLPKFAREIRPTVNLPCYKLQTNATKLGNWTNGVPTVGTTPAGVANNSQIISLPCIPSRIYVFAQPDEAVLTMNDPDFTFMICEGLNVQWGVNTYMQNIRLEQLYASAVDAGYAFPWENFGGSYLLGAADPQAPTVVGSSGAILCLRPGIDFPLEAGQAVGQNGRFQLMITANFHEQRATKSASASMWVVAVLPSVMTLTSSYTCSVITGPVTEQDILEASDKVSGSVVSASDVHNAFGSGIFDSIKSALPYVRKLGKYAHAGLSAAKDAGLLGEGVMSGGSALSGGAASLYGGARLTAEDLRRARR